MKGVTRSREERATDYVDCFLLGLVLLVASPILVPIGIIWGVGWLCTFVVDWFTKEKAPE